MRDIESIKIIKNFIDKEDIVKFISYINLNIDKFKIDPRSTGGNRYSYKFGKDAVHSESRHSLEELNDIADLVNKYTKKSCLAAQENFNDKNEVFLSSFWLAKQCSGASVTYHKDTDEDNNLQFKYSAVIYLNTMLDGQGKLDFPALNFKYSPEEGDLVLFPSQGNQFWHGVDLISEERYSIAIWMTTDKMFELT